jgi:hypothetical protein
MPKPKLTRTSNNKVLSAIKSHKLVVVLLLLVMIFPGRFVYNYYKDWDNAQMIKGLAKDFHALVTELESATGLDLEIKTDCSITQEKFGEGAKTCALGTGGDTTKDEDIRKILGKKLTELSETNSTLEYAYKGKNSCLYKFFDETASGSRFYIECITAVREANTDLAREVFLNQ